jgi:hypothetical protein
MDFGDVFSNSLYDFSHGVNNYTDAHSSAQPPITLVFVSLAVRPRELGDMEGERQAMRRTLRVTPRTGWAM